MKIGLVTIYHVPNYGSVLQAYATQQLLCSLGHDVKIIQYNYFNDRWYAELGRSPSFRERFYWLKTILMPLSKAAVLQRFRRKFLNFTEPFDSEASMMVHDWSDYDAFVVGSDQVWNCRYLLGDPCFLLKFAPANIKRYSLSSSFATSYVDSKYAASFREELSKFSAISVRESNAVTIINSQLGINVPVEVTLDPTLLLNKSQWLSLFPKSKKRTKPYILYYMWSYAFEPRPYIYEVTDYFRRQTGYEVVALEGIRDSKDCQKIGFVDADNSTIPEFLELFHNASLVITSSFHGTAFALNFGIPLISVVPDNAGDDRQVSLLKAVGADNCIVRINSEIPQIQPQYDVERVSQVLDEIRNRNINWIRENINNG